MNLWILLRSLWTGLVSRSHFLLLTFLNDFWGFIPSIKSNKFSKDADNINDPPCAIPVSIIKLGLTLKTISWKVTISWGYWIIGLPNQEKL